jgi:hypothetical protein
MKVKDHFEDGIKQMDLFVKACPKADREPKLPQQADGYIRKADGTIERFDLEEFESQFLKYAEFYPAKMVR